MADAEKATGNEFFKAGNYEQAIVHFTNAIDIEPTHVLYSNRSACYCGLKKYDEALADAEACIAKNAGWGKGYGRKGAAFHGKGQYEAAIQAYEEGLKVRICSPLFQRQTSVSQSAAAASSCLRSAPAAASRLQPALQQPAAGQPAACQTQRATSSHLAPVPLCE